MGVNSGAIIFIFFASLFGFGVIWFIVTIIDKKSSRVQEQEREINRNILLREVAVVGSIVEINNNRDFSTHHEDPLPLYEPRVSSTNANHIILANDTSQIQNQMQASEVTTVPIGRPPTYRL
jgi:hypothetical protein